MACTISLYLRFAFSAHIIGDLPMAGDDLLYAKPNKKSKQAKNSMRGKAPDGRGKNSCVIIVRKMCYIHEKVIIKI